MIQQPNVTEAEARRVAECREIERQARLRADQAGRDMAAERDLEIQLDADEAAAIRALIQVYLTRATLRAVRADIQQEAQFPPEVMQEICEIYGARLNDSDIRAAVPDGHAGGAALAALRALDNITNERVRV